MNMINLDFYFQITIFYILFSMEFLSSFELFSYVFW